MTYDEVMRKFFPNFAEAEVITENHPGPPKEGYKLVKRVRYEWVPLPLEEILRKKLEDIK